jgi:hypothetical protein
MRAKLDVLLINLVIDDVIFMAEKYPNMKIVINNIDSVIAKGKGKPKSRHTNIES